MNKIDKVCYNKAVILQLSSTKVKSLSCVHEQSVLVMVIYEIMIYDLSQCQAKETSWHVRPSKTQISLCIRTVLSEFLMGVLWVAKGPTLVQLEY